MTIDEFIRARLAEDETIARAALRHPTKYNPETREHERTGTDSGEWHTDSYVDPNDKRMVHGASMTIYDEGGHTAEQAAHIAHYDPARELRQVAATRDMFLFILESSGMWELLVGARPPSAEQASADIEKIRAVRAMVAVWRNHPDYRPEWSPD
ncbi:DUF6221 family protein [Nocardia sp. NPDC050630]|uniref:DUF6221 family protein n=1 Tax=Nocardia sp. NPDC050630 TaxID=3364321 RepID=UPI0037A5AA8E